MFIDCDANATYALDDCGRELLVEALQVLGNPSSLHRSGQRAKNAIDDARDAVRRLVGIGGADSSRYRVVFTSGATEANNLLIASNARSGARVIATEVEHPCVLMPLERAAQSGCMVSLIAPSQQGSVNPDMLARLVDETTTLVSVMAANNETGAVHPVRDFVSLVRQSSSTALVHSDVAQVVGKLPFSIVETGLDAITISGHKFGALTGVGALIIREHCALQPLILGGPQEDKLRGGTENVLGMVHMGLVADQIADKLKQREDTMKRVRDAFEAAVREKLPDCEFNADSIPRLPNTSSVYVPGVRADDLVVALDLKGILVSAGAACSSGKPQPSHVLTAMGQGEERVRSTLRVSFRADQSEDVGRTVAEALAEVVVRARALREEG